MAINDCIVHSPKTSSEFHHAVNQLRREKKFHTDIYQQLPNRCCSCNGQIGLKTIDLKILRKICHDLLLSWATKVHVPFPKNLNKIILTKRSKPKKNKILKDQIQDELKEEFDEYEYHSWIPRNRYSRRLMKYSSISMIKFKPANEINGYNVNHHQYSFKLHHALQQIQLHDCCSSDDDDEGEDVIDSTMSSDMCDEIAPKASVQQRSQVSTNLILLPLTYSDNIDERCRKIGILIGKKGRHLRALENKYNVRVNVVISNSSRQLRQSLTQVLEHSGMRYDYSHRTLYVLLDNIDMTASETIVSEIRQTLIEKWNKINNLS